MQAAKTYSASTYGEWGIRDLSEPIRQGDIFAWIRPEKRDCWTQFGIVLTADCDIALDKHRGVLTYCPILRLRDFITVFWLRDELQKQLELQRDSVRDLIYGIQKKYQSKFDLPVDAQVVAVWLARRGSSGIADDLSLPEGQQRIALIERLDLFSRIGAAMDEDDLAKGVHVLSLAKLGKLEPSPSKLAAQKERVWKDFCSRTRKPAGDMFFLNELRDDVAGGFVVYLRRLAEIHHGAIAINPVSERRDATVVAVRLSQVSPPFRYRITQKLAAVFSDIGLPGDYEAACPLTTRRLGTSLGVIPLGGEGA